MRHQTVKIAFITALIVYFGIGLLLYVNQRRMLYFPTQAIADAGADSITLPVVGATLHIYVVRAGRERALIYFGGNASSASDSRAFFAAEFPDHSSYLPDYRSYGRSTGQPTQAALFADALALFDAVREHHRHIDVIGLSLGSGIAAHVAAERPVEKLALVTPYDSIRRVAQGRFPFYPMSVLLKDPYDSLSLVPRISAPTLIVIAGLDETIPSQRSEALAQAFPPAQRRVEVFATATHNTLWDRADYRALLREFFSADDADF